MGLLVIVVMLLLPVNVFLGFIHTWLIPLPMGTKAVSLLASHAGNPDKMYSELDAVRMRHETWAMREGLRLKRPTRSSICYGELGLF